MEIVLRGILIYFSLFILFRIGGKRVINESTPFGLVLILLISSSVSDSLKDEDRSLTAGLLLATTLLAIHLSLAFVKRGRHGITRIIDDVPTLLVRDGEVFEKTLKESKLNMEDVLAAARKQKVTGIQEIKYAILETDGSINIISKEG